MSWLAPAVAGAAGAALGVLVGLGWSAQSAPKAQSKPRVVAERGSVSSAQNADELASLSERVRSLEQRVSLLTAALGAQRRGGEDAPAAHEAAGEAEGNAPAGTQQPADVADPVFEAAVRDILERVDDERRQERTTRTQRRAKHGAERASERFSEELGLNERQKQELFEIMKKHYESVAALRDSDDQPGTPGEWRERTTELRRKTEEQIERALSPAQAEKFQTLDGSEFFGGPRRLRRPEP